MSRNQVRPPAVAGLFYSSSSEDLFEQIHRCFTHPLGPGKFPSHSRSANSTERVECIIVPHAGYEYSGPIAAHSYMVAYDFFSANANRKVTAFILGPNHYGIGSGVAASPNKAWRTPLGDVSVDSEIVNALTASASIIDVDEVSHSREHSIEVQLPFLQAVVDKSCDLSIVPISLMLQDNETASQVADSIMRVLNSTDRAFLIIGSSDLTHYEPQKQANSKDLKLLEQVNKLDTNRFYTVLEREEVTSCGYGAIAVVMSIAKKSRKKEGLVLKYATSGDITGDNSSVVGYSSVRFV